MEAQLATHAFLLRALALTTLLAPAATSQIEEFDDLGWTLLNAVVQDDALTISSIGYGGSGFGETVVPETGRLTFDLDFYLKPTFGGFCADFIASASVGCLPAEPDLEFYQDVGVNEFQHFGSWSLDVAAGDCLRLDAANVGWVKECQMIATYANLEFEPALSASPASLSVTTGGVQALHLVAPEPLANELYFVLGTLSGTDPGLLVDSFVVPLNVDAYFLYTLTNPGGPLLPKSLGFLGPDGRAKVDFRLPGNAPAALVGATMDHAYVVLDASGSLAFASPPASVSFLP